MESKTPIHRLDTAQFRSAAGARDDLDQHTPRHSVPATPC
jgi:hypothetical protein